MTEVKREMEKKQSERVNETPSETSLFFLTSYFQLILDLQKSWKNSTETSHIPLTQLPLMLTFYTTMAQLSRPGH